MTPTMVAVLLRPLFSFLIMAAIVLPIEWVLFRLFPKCRLKVMLFRNRTGAHARPGDKRVMVAGVVIAYVLLFAWIGILQG